MGLYIENTFHAPYSYFHKFRLALAKAAGYETDEDDYYIVEGKFLKKNYGGKWSKIPNDPLLILLIHYDCDGIIKHEHLLTLANRLKDFRGKIHQYNDMLDKFITGLESTYAKNENCEFC